MLCCVVSLLWCCVILCLSHPVPGPSASEVKCLLLACKSSFTVVLSSSSLKRLLYLWTCSLAWHHRLSSKSSIVLWAQAHQEGTCRRVRKLYLNSYTSVVNRYKQRGIHTSIQAQPQTKWPPCPRDYVPHAKAFGNKYSCYEGSVQLGATSDEYWPSH